MSDPIPIDYFTPDAPRRWWWRRLNPLQKLFGSALICIPLAGAIYVYVGAKICQRVVGQTVLFAPATGTDAFDFWLITVPQAVVGAGLTLVSCLAFLSAAFAELIGRRRAAWRLLGVIPISLVLFVVFFFACAPIWEDISP
jgi:hypothetical protein